MARIISRKKTTTKTEVKALDKMKGLREAIGLEDRGWVEGVIKSTEED